jgi:hypothetical protein
MGQLTPSEREVLTAVVDTAVPALAVEPDPTGFWGRRGSDVGADVMVRRFVEELPDRRFDALGQLLATLDRLGIRHRDRAGREAILHTVSESSAAAARTVRSLRATACMAAAMVPDQHGRNRFWDHWRCRAGMWWSWRPAAQPAAETTPNSSPSPTRG